MRYLLLPFLALVGGICLCGCNSEDEQPIVQKPPKGMVAIVDLDEVARRLGRDVEMIGSIKSRAGALNDQLNSVQANYVKELTERKERFGGTRTKEQDEQLLNLQQTANVQFNQLRKKAQSNLTEHQQLLIHQYRTEVRPIAQKIAEEKGLSVVITKNDAVIFSFSSSVDITADVAKRMSSLPRPRATTPTIRTAEFPSTTEKK